MQTAPYFHHNEQGFSQEAIDLVNSVRLRAGLPGLNTSPATTVSNQEELREWIRNERRVEFVLEGINYFDELGWGAWAIPASEIQMTELQQNPGWIN